ncbi:MAG: HAD hydrolase-like protein [Bacteroidaceae bacterium]|nr:HAD hydrolase-like protein [Bacteroidaceae bacterium]
MMIDALQKYLKENNYSQFHLKTAMFDMDGVLFDSMKNHSRCWHEAMKHYGFNLPREEAYMHEGRTGAGTINIVSLRERGHEATEEEIEKIYAYKSQLFNACPKAERMPGANELLQQVKASGIIPMLVTGSGQKTLLERLHRNFPGIFLPELMVTAFDVQYGKPNPEPYIMGLQKAYQYLHPDTSSKPTPHLSPLGGSRRGAISRLAPNCSIVVENAPLGVQAAVAAGVFTIAVNTGPLPDSALLDEGANLLFPSMQALSDAWQTLLHDIQTVKV